MKPLKIVFMGSPDFAVPALERIYYSPHAIIAVVSNPDKRRGRRGKPVPTAVKKRALELNLPIVDTENVTSKEFQKKLSGLKPDLLVVVAFRILPPEVLDIPKEGSVNLHASLLPKYRGAAPIHWAIINGEKETGCTVFFLNEKVDSGQIILREKTEIGEMETTGDVYNRLKMMGAGLLLESLNRISEGDVELQDQDHSKASPAPKLFRDNTKIDFSRPANDVHNFIRGLSPFPKAWCEYEGKKLNIYRSKPVFDLPVRSGELLFIENRLFAGCKEGSVELLQLQLPGTKVLTGTEFASGFNLDVKLQ